MKVFSLNLSVRRDLKKKKKKKLETTRIERRLSNAPRRGETAMKKDLGDEKRENKRGSRRNNARREKKKKKNVGKGTRPRKTREASPIAKVSSRDSHTTRRRKRFRYNSRKDDAPIPAQRGRGRVGSTREETTSLVGEGGSFSPRLG